MFNYFPGNKWHGRRKFLTPAFHFKILEEYLKVFNANSQILVEKLGAKIGETFVEITSYVSVCTLDIICGNFIPLNPFSFKSLKYTERNFYIFSHHGNPPGTLTHKNHANLDAVVLMYEGSCKIWWNSCTWRHELHCYIAVSMLQYV